MHAARVAPEKTASPPSCRVLQHLEREGDSKVAKLTYSEQLRHPNWQRRRLEMLQSQNFTCETCADKEKTLHVHHRRYVKGRMAWEYADYELAVLCEDCHASEHEIRADLDNVLCRLSDAELLTVIGYVEGLLVRNSFGDGAWDISVSSGEHIFGISDAIGVSFHDVSDAVKDDRTTSTALLQLMRDRFKSNA